MLSRMKKEALPAEPAGFTHTDFSTDSRVILARVGADYWLNEPQRIELYRVYDYWLDDVNSLPPSTPLLPLSEPLFGP
jgi:hypothetical protein